MQDTQEIALGRGLAARQFRESPVYASVRDELIAEHTARLLDTDFLDAEGRETHFRAIRAFQLLDAELEARAIIAGAITRNAAADDEAQPEQIEE